MFYFPESQCDLCSLTQSPSHIYSHNDIRRKGNISPHCTLTRLPFLHVSPMHEFCKAKISFLFQKTVGTKFTKCLISLFLPQFLLEFLWMMCHCGSDCDFSLYLWSHRIFKLFLALCSSLSYSLCLILHLPSYSHLVSFQNNPTVLSGTLPVKPANPYDPGSFPKH